MTKNWLITFKNALEGCFYAFRTQKNFKVHLVLSFLVLILAVWLKVSLIKFLFLISAVFFGLTIEMANTAFEKTVDLVTEEYHPKARIVKDVSAGMMLVASIGLAVLGALILLPLLWQKLLG